MFSRSPSPSEDDSSPSLDGYASEASSVREDEKLAPLPEGAFNYLENANASAESRKLASYVRKYRASFKRLPLLLKPLPRQFFPAIGEVDALLKIPPPDGSWDPTGLEFVDEPALEQSDSAALWLELAAIRPCKPADKSDGGPPCIEEQGKERNFRIDKWIETVRRLKSQHHGSDVWHFLDSLDFDTLMRPWPEEIAKMMEPNPQKLALEETSLGLADILKIGCALLRIPRTGHHLNASLHALLMLYLELSGSNGLCSRDRESG
ncbi:intraflagellar transport protein 46 [Cystoisospora suis]|uniref:Intraflagellar transport protein 46 n=1 Tax=Cystoisospora suis TaxID=483139 RepID=A0A2C6L2Z8_9APIC|nr:intraflagellar transport protein 46 [Cystoisospora suis]